MNISPSPDNQDPFESELQSMLRQNADHAPAGPSRQRVAHALSARRGRRLAIAAVVVGIITLSISTVQYHPANHGDHGQLASSDGHRRGWQPLRVEGMRDNDTMLVTIDTTSSDTDTLNAAFGVGEQPSAGIFFPPTKLPPATTPSERIPYSLKASVSAGYDTTDSSGHTRERIMGLRSEEVRQYTRRAKSTPGGGINDGDVHLRDNDGESSPTSSEASLADDKQTDAEILERIAAEVAEKDQSAYASAMDRIYSCPSGELWTAPTLRDGKLVQDAVAFPLTHTAANIDILGYVANTTVTQAYTNPFDRAIEAIYVFPLPADAAVHHYVMHIGKRSILGLIRKRAEAKQIYDDAKAQGYTAALLEQERPNIFTQSIANIAPHENINVEIAYVNRASLAHATYEYSFPMVVGPRYTGHTSDAERVTPAYLPEDVRNGHSISVQATLDAGHPIQKAWSPTHAVEYIKNSEHAWEFRLERRETIPNRDFVLRWQVEGDLAKPALLATAQSQGGHLTLMFNPPESFMPADVGAREITFVLDISGSMSGVPLDLSKQIVRRALDRMRPNDAFNIFFFAGGNGQLWETPQPNTSQNLQRAIEFLDGMQAGGGTEMLAGLERLFASERAPGRTRMVVFLTDGYVGNEETIIKTIKNNVATSRFFAFGIGSSVNRYLIDGVGRYGRGHATVALPRDFEAPERLVDEFYQHIDAPVFTDIRIDWNGLAVEDMYPRLVPDVFAGLPVSVCARYLRAGQGNIIVSGYRGSEYLSYTVPVTLPAQTDEHVGIASIWARARIDDLCEQRMDVIDDEEGRKQAEALSAEIVEVALEHHLVSEGTSFVAVDDSRIVSDGNPDKVNVPAELPEGVSREGTLGNAGGEPEQEK